MRTMSLAIGRLRQAPVSPPAQAKEAINNGLK